MPWKKGQSGNPTGRVKNPEIAFLRQAIEEVDKEYKESFYKYIAKRARKNDQMAIAVLKKFVPDKAHVEEILEGGIDVKFEVVDTQENKK